MRCKARFALTTLAMAVTVAGTQAQSAADEAAIRATVQAYFDGMMRGSPETLRKAFDAQAFLIGPGRTEPNRIPFERWSQGMTKPIPDPETHKNTILSIDIAGDAAVAKTELDWPRVKYVDYLSLLKVNGEWRIVNKIWHQEASTRPQPTIDAKPISTADLARYTGEYVYGENQRVFISSEDGKLMNRMGPDDKTGFQLFYQGDHTFIPAVDATLRLSFVVEKERAVRFTVSQNGEAGVQAKRVN